MWNFLRKYMKSIDLNIKLSKVYNFEKLPMVFRQEYSFDKLNYYRKRFGYFYVLETDNRKYLIHGYYSQIKKGTSWVIFDDRGFTLDEPQILNQLSLDAISSSFKEIFELLLLHLDVKIVD